MSSAGLLGALLGLHFALPIASLSFPEEGSSLGPSAQGLALAREAGWAWDGLALPLDANLWTGEDVLDAAVAKRTQQRGLAGGKAVAVVETQKVRLAPLGPLPSHYNRSWVLAEAGRRADLPVAELLAVDDVPHVALMGMMASGTNLLMTLLSHDLPVHVLDRLDFGLGLFWKHAPVAQVRAGRRDNPKSFQKAFGVAIVRNPLSLFTHYVGLSEKHMCGKWWGSISDKMLKESCGPWKQKADAWDGGGVYSVKAKNVATLWNAYARGYLRELPELGFNRTLLLRYEDLLEDPGEAVGRIGSLMGLEGPGKVRLPFEPQGPASRSSRSLALAELRKQTYLARYSREELSLACSHLDLDLMRELRYTDCDNAMEHSNSRRSQLTPLRYVCLVTLLLATSVLWVS